MHSNVAECLNVAEFRSPQSHTSRFRKKRFTVGVHQYIFASKAVFSFKILL